MHAATKRLITHAFFLILSSSLLAVQPFTPPYPDALLETWRWRSFPELENAGILCMTEGEEGVLWFGTESGVIRYDGLYIQNHPLQMAVTSFLYSRTGVVCAGTEKGIYRLEHDLWRPICPMKYHFPWSVSGMIESSDGRLYAGTKFGLLCIRENQITIHAAADQADMIRALTTNVHLMVVPDRISTQHDWGRGFGMAARASMVYVLAPDGPARRAGIQAGDSILTVNGRKQPSFAFYNNQSDSMVHLRLRRCRDGQVFEAVLKNEYVTGRLRELLAYNLFQDKNGDFWFSQDFGNISCFKRQATGEEWRTFSLTEGINANVKNTYMFAQTHDGHIWASLNQPQSRLLEFDGSTWSGFPI